MITLENDVDMGTRLTEAREAARLAAYKVLHHAEQAEDVAQDVMLTLLDRDMAAVDNLAGYASVCGKRAAIDVQRRAAYEAQASLNDYEWVVTILESRPGPETQAMREAVLRYLLKPLSDKEFEVFADSIEGFSNAELAVRHGFASANVVGVTLTRIRNKIRGAYDSDEIRELLRGVREIKTCFARGATSLDHFDVSAFVAPPVPTIEELRADLARAMRRGRSITGNFSARPNVK